MRCFCASLYAVVDSGCEESAITPAIPYRSPGCSAEGPLGFVLSGWIVDGWLAGGSIVSASDRSLISV